MTRRGVIAYALTAAALFAVGDARAEVGLVDACNDTSIAGMTSGDCPDGSRAWIRPVPDTIVLSCPASTPEGECTWNSATVSYVRFGELAADDWLWTCALDIAPGTWSGPDPCTSDSSNKPRVRKSDIVLASSAERTISFTTDIEQAAGEASPTLTWSTTPSADACTAGGDWSGEKGPSGMETVGPITSSATYRLTCTWPADGSATLSWTLPTENVDGTPYDDPGSLLILYNVDVAPEDGLTLMEPIENPLVTSRVIEGLTPGTWTFEAYAINDEGFESDPSNRVSKTISAETETTETVAVTVNPKPGPIAGLQVQ